MAPALHLGDGRIIGKKVKAFVSTSEENLILLKAFDLDANEVYEIRNQENTQNVKQILKKNLDDLSEGESFIQEFENSIIIFKWVLLRLVFMKPQTDFRQIIASKNITYESGFDMHPNHL